MKRKKQLFILGFIIIFLIIILLLRIYTDSKKGLKKINNNFVTYKYNIFWEVKKNNKNSISLKHKNGSVMNLYIKENNNSNMSLNEYAKIIINNYQYTKITSEDNNVVNENNYEGKNILLENKNKEILLTIFKKGDLIIINEYISTLKKFDTLIDSVLTTNYYLKIKDVR